MRDHWGDKADVIGYCIGGTLTAMLLAYLARVNFPLVSSATFFATLVDFNEPGEIGAFISDESLSYIEDRMAKEGYFSGREMADAFNMLRANDLIWSVAVNRYLLGKHAPAFDLLYWNSDVTRIPQKLHSYYLRQMYVENNLIKPDKLEADGVPLDLGRVTTPTYCVATADDHIAPWRSVYAMTQLFRGERTFRLGASGHIAGIISPPGKKKALWWGAEPGAAAPPSPDDWLAGAPKHEGSWWPEWAAWLAARSPEKVPAPATLGAVARTARRRPRDVRPRALTIRAGMQAPGPLRTGAGFMLEHVLPEVVEGAGVEAECVHMRDAYGHDLAQINSSTTAAGASRQ